MSQTRLADIAGVTLAHDAYASTVVLPHTEGPAYPGTSAGAEPTGLPAGSGAGGWTVPADDDESRYLDLLGVPRVGFEPRTATGVLLALADLPHAPHALTGDLNTAAASVIAAADGAAGPARNGAGGGGFGAAGAAGAGIPLPRHQPS